MALEPTTDDIQNYADRIAEGLRHDGYSNRLNTIDVALISSRYGVEIASGTDTIRDLSFAIARASLAKKPVA